MKLLKLSLTFIIYIINSIKSQVIEYTPLLNQKLPYQAQFLPPTKPSELPTANYTFPLLSHILYEIDPKKELKKEEFIQAIKFTGYRLTRGEAELIFEFADRNKNDLLSQTEWDDFTTFYILPFETCDTNKDYLLDSKEFTMLFEKDPDSKYIIFRRR